MAKRTRGSRRDRRRGRPTTVAPASRPQQSPAVGITATDDGRVTVDSLPARLPSSALPNSSALRSTGRLSAGAGEYRYVTLDLRRIAAVIGTLLVAMLALWVAMDVVRVISF